jgi:hypothetical protein
MAEVAGNIEINLVNHGLNFVRLAPAGHILVLFWSHFDLISQTHTQFRPPDPNLVNFDKQYPNFVPPPGTGWSHFGCLGQP